MTEQAPYPRAPFIRDAAANPYDVQGLALSFGGSWAGHYNRNRALEGVPRAGFEHMMGLSKAYVANLCFRNWRNGR